MTIDEIKAYGIVEFLKSEGYDHAYVSRGSYWYLSPFRAESTPSFNVNPAKNLWHDFGEGEGGNIITLVQRLHPSWSCHEVLVYLEKKIKGGVLDYPDRVKPCHKEEWHPSPPVNMSNREEADTVIEYVTELSHPKLRDYIVSRRIDFGIARQYCKEVHYRIRDKHYFAIAFENIAGGIEVRNKYCKRSIGRKYISIVKAGELSSPRCCIFEGFFDMLTYATFRKWKMDIQLCIDGEADYIVLNSVSNVKQLLPHLRNYASIHCYLDNDGAGHKTMMKIKEAYPSQTINESYRYAQYKDINDIINGNQKHKAQ